MAKLLEITSDGKSINLGKPLMNSRLRKYLLVWKESLYSVSLNNWRDIISAQSWEYEAITDLLIGSLELI